MVIDFDTDNQDDFVRTIKTLSGLIREINIELTQVKELICGRKIVDNTKADINWSIAKEVY